MENSKGFKTNALFGFANMINKIIKEEKPEYMLVAFDKGKTFRHEKYDFYKDGRIETPNDLKAQFPLAKEMLGLMGIKYYEIDNYEADDIIGTFSKEITNSDDMKALIISSDKDLLQLVSPKVSMKLLKQKDNISVTYDNFYEIFNIMPPQIIDVKALQGDPSDNIKGVAGVGEKTAIKLINEYHTVQGIYDNIEKIKGALKQKLIDGENDAFTSREIVTIYTEVEMDITIDDLKIVEEKSGLSDLYKELEFFSLLKDSKKETSNMDVLIINNLDDINIETDSSFFLEYSDENYHMAHIVGMSIYNEKNSYFVPKDLLNDVIFKYNKYLVKTYNLKPYLIYCLNNNLDINNNILDLMVAMFLLNYNVKEDISSISNIFFEDIISDYTLYKKFDIDNFDINKIASNSIIKACIIHNNFNTILEEIKKEDVESLFYDIENPLIYVLSKMEANGVNIDLDKLETMRVMVEERLLNIEKIIYEKAGLEFNIASPKQLGSVLFETLQLPHGKKTKTGYSTNVDVLKKIEPYNSIVTDILEHRMLSKLYSTYIVGLKTFVLNDNKIHTIFNQIITRTGRLSSSYPNLQNIPVRYELGRELRRVFIPSNNNVMLACDYSQIELRILAHMAEATSLIDAFNNDIDIHTKTASDVFKIPLEDVSSDLRRRAKAVNFGIMYGISNFGLSEDLDISVNEAKAFIEDYLTTYPEIKNYMDNIIKEAYSDYSVKTLFNRKRVIDELKSTNYMVRSMGERMVMNTPVQGTSADIIKIAMINIQKEIESRNLKSKIILQVHDELIFDCPKEELDDMIELVSRLMSKVIQLKVPITVSVAHGDSWFEAK